ncbi:dimethylargininase [Actinomadura xylanilytica]|uniref:dimethylargininase n=1 Tax=Actinomadura xylanilytica TaxID=887459 RepID=UPI0032E48812
MPNRTDAIRTAGTDRRPVADPRPRRTAAPRRYLMCPPTYFDVTYSINPWMEPGKPVDTGLAFTQWDRLRNLYLGLGHQVELIDPVPGLPDMVFAANGATVVNGRVLAARFRHGERAAEGAAYAGWFREHGYPVHETRHVNEGEGDLLVTGDRVLAGHGFRTDRRAHDEAARVLGLPVVPLTLVDPRFYHLDTALAVLDHEEIMYYPAAFGPESRALLAELYPDAILANDSDAEVFGLNAVSDGRHVLLPEQAAHLIERLSERGFVPIGVDLGELLKSGGSTKCCTLEIRGPVEAREGGGSRTGGAAR